MEDIEEIIKMEIYEDLKAGEEEYKQCLYESNKGEYK